MKGNDLHIDLSKLTALRKKLGTDKIARVGVMGAEATTLHKDSVTVYDTKTGAAKRTAGADTPLSNAELAVIHIYGSVTRNIPPRDFLRAPIFEKNKEIVKMLGTKEVKELIARGDIEAVFGLIGVKGEQIVQRAFETGGFGKWPALQQSTIDEKGSSAPLIDTAQLRRSVTSDVVKR